MKPGNLLIGLGIAAILVGLAVKLGWLSWFGHLPGDIRAGGDHTRFYFPITSSIVISVIATIVLNVVVRFFRDQ